MKIENRRNERSVETKFDFLIRNVHPFTTKKAAIEFRSGDRSVFEQVTIVSHGHTSIFMVNRVKYTRGKSEPPRANQAILLLSSSSPLLSSGGIESLPNLKDAASTASFYNGSRYNEAARYAAFPY